MPGLRVGSEGLFGFRALSSLPFPLQNQLVPNLPARLRNRRLDLGGTMKILAIIYKNRVRLFRLLGNSGARLFIGRLCGEVRSIEIIGGEWLVNLTNAFLYADIIQRGEP